MSVTGSVEVKFPKEKLLGSEERIRESDFLELTASSSSFNLKAKPESKCMSSM